MPTLEQILRSAHQAQASDIHITVGLPPKMRVFGKLITMDFPEMMPSDTVDMCLEIMSPFQRERFEECGEYDMSVSFRDIGRFRVNVFRQKGSVALALRAVGINIPSPESLGVPSTAIDLFTRKRGLVLVTGPAGSGKTTTLASFIDKINTYRDCHIITLEEPIEYLHSHKMSMINQREVGLDTRSFADGFRAALREDPDVILVDEMRDVETISIAITAAEMGYLVFSTLHTVDAPGTIDRIIDAFPPNHQQQIGMRLANVLEAVVSQQLIPTVNEDGQAAAFEVLLANHEIRSLIREGKIDQITSVMRVNQKEGMLTMDDALVNLYLNHYITKENAIWYARDPIGMQSKL